MIVELAQIEIVPGKEAEFERGASAAKALFLAAQGCHGFNLWRSIEQPFRYRLVVKWSTVEDHTITFRGSPAFAEWRALVADCFASPPQVEHQQSVTLL